MQRDDEQATGLLEAARAGDAAAFERLYRRHVGRVYAVCLRMTADTRTAEDLTQEAFVRAWQSLDSFRGEAAFATWLHRIAVNVVLSHRRSAGKRWGRLVATERLPAAPEPQRGRMPAAAMDLERAIRSLPEGARRVFVLHEVEGYRHEEIAAMDGIAVGTSKAQLHRARRLLREALGR